MTQNPLRDAHRTAWFCALAIIGFAANSLLTRLALRPGLIDASTFVAVRLTTGAFALGLLARLRSAPATPASLGAGSWQSALLLFAYAAPFSYAYLRMGAGTGALVLFGAVQVTMIGWGLVRGERPRAGEWLGLALAFLGLAALTLPGATRPDLLSFCLMVGAGVAWGSYSIRGRASFDPLGTTAGNFWRSVPFALALAAWSWVQGPTSARAQISGVALAAASGAIASGLAYTFWYAAIATMSALTAALVQLTVPVLAALAATVLLDEPLTFRLVGAGVAVLGGVSIALRARCVAR